MDRTPQDPLRALEADQSLTAARLQSLVRILQYRAESTQAFLDHALDEAIRLTESRFGYIYHYQEEQRRFVLNTWSKEVMDVCSVTAPQTTYDLDKTGIWGEAVRQRRPIVLNDFAAPHPLKKGHPPGHAPLTRFLTVPVFDGERIVAVVGLANKAAPYTDTDVLQLTLLMESVFKVVDRIRAEEALARSEAELRRSQKLFQKVFDTLPIGLWIADRDGRLVTANPAGRRIWGAEPYVGQEEYGVFKARRLPSGEEIAPDDWALAHTVRQGVTVSDEMLEIDAFDGSKKIILNYTAPVFDDDGHVEAAIVVNQDITSRRRAETALEAERRNFQAILDASPVGMLVFDRSEEIRYANPAAETLFGKTLSQLTALRCGDFLACVNRKIAQGGCSASPGCPLCPLYRAIRNGLSGKGGASDRQGDAMLAVDDSSEPLWVRFKASPVTLKEGPGVVMALDDISAQMRFKSEKQRLEEQFQQAQKLEGIGRLAGGVAHDLNNLLTPILGYAEMLLEDISPDDARSAAVGEIQAAGLRARNLVRQLLAFSRKQTLELKPLDLNRVVEGFERLLRRTIREDVIIELALAESLPLVLADVGQMEQVVLNLAVNAQDAMPDGGRLIIETGCADLDAAYAAEHSGVKPGPYVLLALSDNGCGMAPETCRQIFEPFFTTKEKDRGTGLGLATVYGIVKQHGGHVWVYSEPDRGTTFKIYLPHSHRTDSLVPEVKPAAVARGSETILLAEDNPHVRSLARTMLERQGYTVLEAENGRDAIAALARHTGPVALLLTDVIMPDINGKELFGRLARAQPDLKVLYMSGYTANVIAHRGVLDPGVDFIQKPFSVQALTAKVREVLEG